MSYLPGNTMLPEEEKRDTSTLVPLRKGTASPPLLVLGSSEVNDTSLFMNGLTQNIIILYELFESLGYCPYLLQGPPVDPKGNRMGQYRTVTAMEMVASALPVRLFIEIGRSLDPPHRQYLRSIGATIVKLYLGNILNIDVETIQYYPSMFFHHHIVGDIHEIWTSPHYQQHLEYAAILNRTDPATARVVPYVWDPCFLTRLRPPTVSAGSLEWLPPSDSSTQDMVIMDPGISFQKCAFYSILLAESYARLHPEWKGVLHIINGDRLHLNAHAKNQLLPSLTLHQQGRIRYYPRKRIHEILMEYPSACFLTHQWNNDYNYLTLELMYSQFPVVHNTEGWAEYGYSYAIHRWEDAIQTLHTALTCHKENQAIYRSHAAQLVQRHSIHDPEVRRRWRAILEDVIVPLPLAEPNAC